ncbi:hypothetical protein KR018_009958, partial [Drosophila ironensis]
ICGQDFGYEGRSGPENWGKKYARCTGKYQSPININRVNVKLHNFTQLEFLNFNAIPKNSLVANNGHTVLVTMGFDTGKVPTVMGGPLAEKSTLGYQFEQFHFHWGVNDTVGSEDLIDNQAFPAELHVVLRNLKYPNFISALGKDHGIAVMAFFFQVSKYTVTGAYGDFTKQLSQIERKGQSANATNPRPLRHFVSDVLDSYYTYTGSLTTPPCSEEVIWMDFRSPIRITEKQINAFRLLTANDEHLKNNFRPTQPLNDRPVFINSVDPPIIVDPANSGSEWKTLSQTVFLIFCIVFVIKK